MRIISVLSTCLFGIAAILLGLVWIQGNMALPGELHRYFWEKLSWPWLSFEGSSVLIRAIVDESLVCLLFLFSQILNLQLLNLKIFRQKIFPARFARSVQLTLTGVLFFTVISCWQHTGIIAWDQYPHLGGFCSAVFFLLVLFAFASSLALSFGRLLSARAWSIALGFEQLYSTETEARQLTTPFKLQRISLSLIAVAMLIGTPMSLDRLLFALPIGLIALKSWLQPEIKPETQSRATSSSDYQVVPAAGPGSAHSS